MTNAHSPYYWPVGLAHTNLSDGRGPCRFSQAMAASRRTNTTGVDTWCFHRTRGGDSIYSRNIETFFLCVGLNIHKK